MFCDIHLGTVLFLFNTLRPRQMADVSQMTFSNAFSWMKMYWFLLRFHWSVFLRVQLTIFQHWVRLWLGDGQATSHYLEQWWLVYWCIYESLGLNKLTMLSADELNLQHMFMYNNFEFTATSPRVQWVPWQCSWCIFSNKNISDGLIIGYDRHACFGGMMMILGEKMKNSVSS